MDKTRLNISMDKDIAEYIRIYARENRTSVSELMTQFVLSIKRRREGQNMEQVFADPEFYNALLETQEKIQTGKAAWYTFEEVFA